MTAYLDLAENRAERQDREYISDFDREIKRIQGAKEESDDW